MGGSHIGETPCDGSEGGGGGGASRQGCCGANGGTKEVKDRRSFHQSHHQGSSTLCVVPSHRRHADMWHVGLWVCVPAARRQSPSGQNADEEAGRCK